MTFYFTRTQRLCRGLGEILRREEKRGAKGCCIDISLQDVRNLSTSPCFQSSELNKPLKQWTFVVSPFSTVKAQLRCNISVRSLDPHSFPEANRAFITVHGTSADQGLKLDNFYVQYDDQNKELHILSEKVNSNVSVDLTAPIKSDLCITTSGDGNVEIVEMECNNCKVVTENGICVLHSVKGHRVIVKSAGGDIKGTGTIHGNVDISTSGNSMVDIKKIQGTSLNVSTEHGPLKVKAVYAVSTSLSSSSGNVELGSVHGNTTVCTKTGNIIIDGSYGCLKVFSHEGDIDAYVGQHGTADLHSEQGSVSIRVPASIKAEVQLSGSALELNSEVDLQEAKHDCTDTHNSVTAHINGKSEGRARIEARAERGIVRLRSQSWLESLKIRS
ncbi:protein FAM185A isoform X1 [Paramormyrops kingsleyae]|uniref:Family with sequence similarity 185 member A n=2 Tax=Paramormyrops kingsleyae TaxID=1676925 RepID=A0A3B3Q884_9TELE|nr:protein FAM185A isoform X1 [Paramormyrops kingsleyae]